MFTLLNIFIPLLLILFVSISPSSAFLGHRGEFRGVNRFDHDIHRDLFRPFGARVFDAIDAEGEAGVDSAGQEQNHQYHHPSESLTVPPSHYEEPENEDEEPISVEIIVRRPGSPLRKFQKYL